MKTEYKSLIFAAAVLALTVATAWCVLIGDEVEATEPTRISVPCTEVCADEHESARKLETADVQCTPLQTETAISEKDYKRTVGGACPYQEDARAPTYDALELMYDTPLRAEVQLEIEALCAAKGVDPAVVLAIIYHESRYVEDAVGDSCNSYGLMQIQPRWHAERMARLGVTDLLDGVENVRVGVDYLDELLDSGGDYLAALTTYNRGHYDGEVNAYAYKVMAMANEMCK